MNYFTNQELHDMGIEGDDSPMVGEAYMTREQAGLCAEQYGLLIVGKARTCIFEFSVLHEDGSVTVHQGQVGRDDRVLI